eukprot:CAMPEP_0185623254 /NCGR_PEP_ID=MMETSP0436-20130131/59742_1 /TAXON_ID=626734 ORGANISM="Favella taraikaensis, Strain Fe Narragansett Bay" /NCGR_SAMPLE_ID=MMETSP0436 /ASSEMBLY_ACC=CAM_ASM_000390 /LENGTH=36 /DNA_ID= /DNA_START= /DNA_END= /DNA_ORIENTATION=
MTNGFKLGGPSPGGKPNATTHGSNRWNGFYPTKFKN